MKTVFVFFLIVLLPQLVFASAVKSALAISCSAENEGVKIQTEISATGEARESIVTDGTTYECSLQLKNFRDLRKGRVATLGFSMVRQKDCAPTLSAKLNERLSDETQISYYPSKKSPRAVVTYLYRRDQSTCVLVKTREVDLNSLIQRLKRNPPSTPTLPPENPSPERTRSKLPVGGRAIQSI